MQLATSAGWRLRGTLGGLLAGLLFVCRVRGHSGVGNSLMAYLGKMLWFRRVFNGHPQSGCEIVVLCSRALAHLGRKALHGS